MGKGSKTTKMRQRANQARKKARLKRLTGSTKKRGKG